MNVKECLDDVKEYLDIVAYIDKSEIPDDDDDDGDVYYSKFDGSYITRVGLEKGLGLHAKHGITEELTSGMGFSPKENKWYGWSHRAIYGFTIGSTCKKGDVHYRSPNLADFIADRIMWNTHEYRDNVRYEGRGEDEDGEYALFTWEYNENIPNKELRGKTHTEKERIPEFGRGEWVAKTMGDAREMAFDFRKGVS